MIHCTVIFPTISAGLIFVDLLFKGGAWPIIAEVGKASFQKLICLSFQSDEFLVNSIP